MRAPLYSSDPNELFEPSTIDDPHPPYARLRSERTSANRDPARVTDPDELLIDRDHPRDHMTFGRGGHFCIGAPIARLEGRIVCEELLRATATIRPRPVRRPTYANSIMVRRLESLPRRGARLDRAAMSERCGNRRRSTAAQRRVLGTHARRFDGLAA